MNVDTVDIELCGSSIEVLILDFTESTTINRIRNICAKSLHIKEICPASDFLIRCEADTD